MARHDAQFHATNPRHDALRFGKTGPVLPMQSETPIADWLVNWGWTILVIGGGAMAIASKVMP
jgi:hypothetical protein